MRRTSVSVVVAMTVLSLAAGAAGAQAPEESSELAQARRELAQARTALERAAQEVARLSTQAAGPVVRQFRMPGRRAMLGINISDGAEGVQVDGVTPGGPAAESGIQTGDVIIAMDGAELTGESPSELLIAQMGNVEPGDSVTLTLTRDGEEQEVEVVTRELMPYRLGRAGRGGPGFGAFPRGGFAGPGFDVFLAGERWWRDMELVELTEALGSYFGADTGILLVRAPSAVTELRDGDVILEIGGRTPNSTEHAVRILASFEPGETLELTIMRDQRRQTLELETPESVQPG